MVRFTGNTNPRCRRVYATKLTVPDEIEQQNIYYPTGNEFVALPLNDAAGAVESFNVLHMGAKGMVEFYGTSAAPLLTPVLRIDEHRVPFTGASWQRLDYWIPRLTMESDGLRITATLCAPADHSGFVYVLTAQNVGTTRRTIDWGWQGCWARSLQTIYRGRPIHGRRMAWYDKWTDTIAFELGAGTALAAFALGAGRPFNETGAYVGSDADAFQHALARRGGPTAAAPLREDNEDGAPLHFAVAETVTLEPGEGAETELYVAVNAEADGACTTVVDLQRHGAHALLERTRAWLQARNRPVSDEALGARLHLNLWFNYFFAAGRTIDTEELVMVTSRSPRYYVSAAFWSRDAFLWSFPGMLLLDAHRAREMVLAGFGRYLPNAGIHSLYIDGTVLYPGFELDELCAYLLALEQYVRATEDYSVLDEIGLGGRKSVMAGVAELEKLLEEKRHPERNLYETFLSPTDDPVTHPYLTYNNAMVWRSLRALALLKKRRGDSLGEWRANQQAVQLRETLRKRSVVEGPRGRMFAWALNDERRAQLLDQPPGSLQLLAYYGFCDEDDPVYVNTVNWIHSTDNPDYVTGAFAGPGCEHAPHPWPLMAAYDLLGSTHTERGLDFFRRAPLDNGIACETVDKETGVVKTGAAFATTAGFIGYALYRALARQ